MAAIWTSDELDKIGNAEALVHMAGRGVIGCSSLSGSAYPDAAQTQRRSPPPHPQDGAQGAELAGL
jgi:hypothetical protein